MKKILLTLLVGMFLISLMNLASAQFYYEQSTELDLNIPCFNNATICSDSTVCNISILYPNSSFLINDQLMTNLQNGYHNYTLNESQTSVLGEYPVTIYCDDVGEKGYSTFTFEIVLVRSKDVSSGEAIFYIPIFIFILSLFFLSLYGAITIPWQNRRNYDGTVMDINNLKYVKLILVFVSYLILLFIFAIGLAVSQNFLRLDVAIAFFNIGFTFLLVALGPILICTVGLLIIHYLADKKIQRAIARGLRPK